MFTPYFQLVRKEGEGGGIGFSSGFRKCLGLLLVFGKLLERGGKRVKRKGKNCLLRKKKKKKKKMIQQQRGRFLPFPVTPKSAGWVDPEQTETIQDGCASFNGSVATHFPFFFLLVKMRLKFIISSLSSMRSFYQRNKETVMFFALIPPPRVCQHPMTFIHSLSFLFFFLFSLSRKRENRNRLKWLSDCEAYHLLYSSPSLPESP